MWNIQLSGSERFTAACGLQDGDGSVTREEFQLGLQPGPTTESGIAFPHGLLFRV